MFEYLYSGKSCTNSNDTINIAKHTYGFNNISGFTFTRPLLWVLRSAVHCSVSGGEVSCQLSASWALHWEEYDILVDGFLHLFFPFFSFLPLRLTYLHFGTYITPFFTDPQLHYIWIYLVWCPAHVSKPVLSSCTFLN